MKNPPKQGVLAWTMKFYPRPASEFLGADMTIGNVRAATEAALLKWRGLSKENLKNYVLSGRIPVGVSDTDCALCMITSNLRNRGGCEACPLYLVRGNTKCYNYRNRGAENTDGLDPWHEYVHCGNARPMILWLERALEFVDQVQAGEEPKVY